MLSLLKTVYSIWAHILKRLGVLKSHVIYAIDASGSSTGFENQIVSGIFDYLKGKNCYVTVILFDDRVLAHKTFPNEITPLDLKQMLNFCGPSGGVGLVIDYLKYHNIAPDMFVLATDGMDYTGMISTMPEEVLQYAPRSHLILLRHD